MSDSVKGFFAPYLGKSKASRKLQAKEDLMIEATENIMLEMERAGVSRADLARALNKQKGFVTRILSGRHNMTIATLSDIAFTLDMVAHIGFNGLYEVDQPKEHDFSATENVRHFIDPASGDRNKSYNVQESKAANG